MVDGRSIYNTVFGATLWETQDLVFDDFERIEFTRGSGAANWGANAVNGTINIITKKASDIEGGKLKLGGGSLLQAYGSYQQGVELAGGHLRISGKYENRAHFSGATYGHWDRGHASFRFDKQIDDNSLFEVHGGFDAAKLGGIIGFENIATGEQTIVNDRSDVDDQWLMAKLETEHQDGSTSKIQSFLWRISKDTVGGVGDLNRFDVLLNMSLPCLPLTNILE